MSKIKLRKKDLDLERTCRIAPAQWEGNHENGKEVFIHYRYGVLRVYIGDYRWKLKIGKDYDGMISLDSVIKLYNKRFNDGKIL